MKGLSRPCGGETHSAGTTRICVFSDSHGNPGPMLRAIDRETPDAMFFLGDGEGDLQAVRRAYPDLPIYSVRGNCDVFGASPVLLKTEIAGRKVFATHGHAYKVKYDRDYQTLRYAALEADARIVLFGHTHIPYHDRVWGMEIVNPGSIGFGAKPSYAVLTVSGDGVTADLKRI